MFDRNQFVGTGEAARLLERSEARVRQLVADGTLKAERAPGGAALIQRDSVDALVRQRESGRASAPRPATPTTRLGKLLAEALQNVPRFDDDDQLRDLERQAGEAEADHAAVVAEYRQTHQQLLTAQAEISLAGSADVSALIGLDATVRRLQVGLEAMRPTLASSAERAAAARAAYDQRSARLQERAEAELLKRWRTVMGRVPKVAAELRSILLELYAVQERAETAASRWHWQRLPLMAAPPRLRELVLGDHLNPAQVDTWLEESRAAGWVE